MNTRLALLVGLAAALATTLVAALIPKAVALEMLFALLVGIALVYFGFVLMDGRKPEIIIEFGGIALTLILAGLGLWANPFWLALGYFAHGVWDVLHHPRGIQTRIPPWYVPFCLIYDWILGGLILLWWW